MDFEDQIAVLADKVVQLGYATTVVMNRKSGMVDFDFTERGQALKKELERIVGAVGDGKGIDPDALHTFVGLMVMTKLPPP